MSVRIRLTRTGRKNLPSYRIAVFDRRTRRDGPALEVLLEADALLADFQIGKTRRDEDHG